MSVGTDDSLATCLTCQHRSPSCPECGGWNGYDVLPPCAQCIRRGPIPVEPIPAPPPEPAIEPDTEIIAPTVVQISDDDLFGIVKARRPAIAPVVENTECFAKLHWAENGVRFEGFARDGYVSITVRKPGATKDEMDAIMARISRAVGGA